MLNLTMTRRVNSKRVSIRAKVNIIMCVGMDRGLLIIMHGSRLASPGGVLRVDPRCCDPKFGSADKVA